jgi:PmbA protein
MLNPANALDILDHALAKARSAGADQADAILTGSSSVSASIRLGALEDLSRSEGVDLGIRVFIGNSSAIVAVSDLSSAAIARSVETALALARAAPPDPFVGLAEAALLCGEGDRPDLDLQDADEPSADALMAMAREAEDFARAGKGITNSEGASAGYGRSFMALATSNGFRGSSEGSSFSLSASVIAGEGLGMQRDYAYHSTRHRDALETPEQIGTKAAARALRRLNPTKLESDRLPVIFSRRVSHSLLGHFSGAINGQSIARKSSFLVDALGTAVFAPAIRITDDPRRPRGLRSRSFDGEGLPTRATDIVADGVLTTWLMEGASARQLGMAPTGHAHRSVSGPPGAGPTNLYLHNGSVSAEALISSIKRGVYITDLIGMGVNGITGDYSRGAAGLLIENGCLAGPVAEITIAGRLQDMFKAMIPANDLAFRYGSNAPTLLVEGMMVAGT